LEEGGGRERGRRMNMVQIMYTHVWKCKKVIPVETVPGIRGGKMKEINGKGESQYDIFDT
jgi:hypothetical protein